MSQPALSRSAQRLAWTRAVLDLPHLELEAASADAGTRSYWRTLGIAPSLIVMDAPPDQNDIRPWLRIHALLDAGGVRVPRVLAQDVDAGFLLLEDLGGPTLAQVIDATSADMHMDAAFRQLIRLQSLSLPKTIPTFDEALLQRDAGLFDTWFVQCHLGLTLDCADSERLQLTQRRLMDNLLSQPQVPVHRDFMLRNLMPVEDGPAVLDFQDMVLGPIAYDPVSLMRDAFLSWPESRVEDWLRRYHACAQASGLPVPPLETFLRDADWCGVQRHLKILGIFARLHHRDGKTRYLADAPRFFAYLDAVVPKYPELHPLLDVLERTIKPAFITRAAA
jgi:hypothetical protein